MAITGVEQAAGIQAALRSASVVDNNKANSKLFTETLKVVEGSMGQTFTRQERATATSSPPSGEANTNATYYRNGVKELSQTGKGFRVNVKG